MSDNEIKFFIATFLGSVLIFVIVLGITFACIRYIRSIDSNLKDLSAPMDSAYPELDPRQTSTPLEILREQYATPKRLLNHDSRGRDNTTFNVAQVYLIRDTFEQYHRARYHTPKGMLVIHAVNTSGDTVGLNVNTMAGLADALNHIFGLNKSLTSYTRSLSF